MNLIIYIDILFLLNLLTDYIILSSTALLIGEKVYKARIFAASFVGALYSVCIFFPQLEILKVILLKIFISMIIILISFKFKGITNFIKTLSVYYVINMFYGGGMYAFRHFTYAGSKMNYSNGVYYIDLSLWQIIVLSFIFYFIIKIFGKIFDSRQIQKNISDIIVCFENTSITVQALLDTGNTLYDPVSLLPVMLIEANQFKNKLSNTFIEKIKQCKGEELIILHKMYPSMKLRIIPFKDITGSNKIIYAFKPSSLTNVSTGKDIENMLIGLVSTKLSEDGSYNALLHSKT